MKLLILGLMLVFCNLALADFSNESEASLVKTGGNSEVQTLNTKTSNIIKSDLNLVRTGGHYTYGETKNGVSARNWDVNGKYERELTHKISSSFGEIIEGNSFIGIKGRYNTDLGAKYYYIKADIKSFFTELSYRYTIEDRYAPIPNTYDNKARLYNEFSHKYSANLQYKFWVEYIPNFTDGKDYLVNGEASMTSILTSMFSLKVSYMGMYDNKPAVSGYKNYDYVTATSLVAKF